MQLGLANDLVIQCGNCGKVHVIDRNLLELNIMSYERQMGEEIEYSFDGECQCDKCGNYLRYSVRGFEYPVGALNYEDSECHGCHFVQSPEIAVDYCEFEYDLYDEKNIYADVYPIEVNIDRILHDNAEIYNLSSREFEELVAEVFRRQGYTVELTSVTRDGGCDIIATKNIDGLPFMLLIECKRYGRKKHVGVQLIRSLLGVQTDKKANKAVLVTTSSFTKDARDFADRQQHLISLVDYSDLLRMMEQSQ